MVHPSFHLIRMNQDILEEQLETQDKIYGIVKPPY